MKVTVKIRWFTLTSRFQIQLGNKLPDDTERCEGNKNSMFISNAIQFKMQ